MVNIHRFEFGRDRDESLRSKIRCADSAKCPQATSQNSVNILCQRVAALLHDWILVLNDP